MSKPVSDGRVVEPRQLGVKKIADRIKGFTLDGDLTDWGGVTDMKFIGPMLDENHFDIAMDEQGLILASVAGVILAIQHKTLQ